MQCGESNANDTGKYGALAAIDLVVQQYLLQYGSDAFPGASDFGNPNAFRHLHDSDGDAIGRASPGNSGAFRRCR